MQFLYKSIFFGIIIPTALFGITQLISSKVPNEEITPNAMTLRLELFTGDIERTVRFYQNVLGFEVLPSGNPHYQPIKSGAVVLGIGSLRSLSKGHYFAPSQPETRFGYGVEIVLEVEDIQLAYDNARKAGADFKAPLAVRPWGLTDFRVVDPNGYYIRVTSKH